ncbi:peptidoglycan DD-metalloendopeptidase family protein [Alkalihalobacillus sp. NPDC078783]
MAERIKGVSIDLDLNTTKVERGMTGLKGTLKTVNSEMKANMSAFDKSDRSIGKYETRLSGLNKKLEVQTKITEEAEKKYRAMVEQHGEGSKEAEKAAQEYNKQAAELNNLQSYTEGVRKELKKLQEEQRIANSGWTKTGQALDATGKKMTKIGDGMQSFGKKWTAGIAIAGGAVVGLGVSLFALTDKATQAADAIAKGSERAGVSTDFYQEMTFWASQNGLAHEQMEKGMGRMNQRLGMAMQGNKKYIDSLTRLGINLEDIENGTLTTEDAFAQSISTLSQMTNEQEKAELATEMFGAKLAQDLMPALNDGSLSIEEAKKQAQELGLVMSEDQLYAAETFQDSWDKIKRSMGAAGMQIGLDLMPKFQELLNFILANMPKIRDTISYAFDQVMEKISATVKWWRELSGGAKTWIKIAAGVVVGIGPLAIVFGTLLKVLGPLTSGLGKLFMWVGRVGGILPAIKIAFAAITGPIGLTVLAITGLVAGFTLAYTKSETFRNIIHQVKDAFVDAYKKVKEFLTTNPQFLSFIDSVKTSFSSAKTIIMDAIGKAMDFVKEKISMVKKFWDSDGQQLLQAFRNVFQGIWKVAEPIIGFLVDAFKFAFPYIKMLVISVIGNIKGVIDGGLKFILGLAKTFSGLFTGDWSKMWEGIKQMVSGAVQFIWNFVQLSFFGKLLGGVKIFVKSFSGFFTNMLTAIRSTFSNILKWIVDFVKNRLTSMQNTVSTISTTIRNTFSQIWNFIWNSIIKPVIRSIVDFVRGRLSTMRDTIRNIFTSVRDVTRNMFNQVKDRIINPVRDAASGVRTRFTDMKNKAVDIFLNMKNNIGKYVTEMIDTVKGMPKKMGDGLKSTAGKIGDGIKAVANKMTEQLGKGVNGVIGGVNWVLDKVGVSSKIKEWSVPQYAHGTDGHKGGLAIVGDGKGENAGRELIQTPDGDRFLSPSKDTLVNLPKGTHVWSALETKEMLKDVPKYNLGTIKNAFSNAWGTTKKVGKKIKDSALDVWDYISNPGKLFNKALDLLGVEAPKMGGILKNVGTGAYSKVKDSFKKYVTDKINGFFDGAEGGGGGIGWKGFRLSSPFNPARRHPITGKVRPHNGDDWAAGMGTPFSAQAAGRVSFSGWAGGYGNLIKIVSGPFERRYGHNQKNLVKAGQMVKAGQRIGLTGSTGDSTGPHVHYEVRKHGVPLNPRGLKTGARVVKRGFYELADGGYPEYVIPTDPARHSDAQKLLALAGKEIQGNKRPNQLSNPSGGTGSGGNGSNDDLLLLLADKVDKMTLILIEMLGLQRDQLEALLAGHDINFDGKPLAKVLQPHLERLKNRKGRGPNG